MAGISIILLLKLLLQLNKQLLIILLNFLFNLLDFILIIIYFGISKCFAPLHLLHKKFGVDLGVVRVVGVNVVLLQKVGGAVDGGFERGVGLVEGGAHHQGLFLLEGVGGGVFVGVELGSEGAVALFQCGGV